MQEEMLRYSDPEDGDRDGGIPAHVHEPVEGLVKKYIHGDDAAKWQSRHGQWHDLSNSIISDYIFQIDEINAPGDWPDARHWWK